MAVQFIVYRKVDDNPDQFRKEVLKLKVWEGDVEVRIFEDGSVTTSIPNSTGNGQGDPIILDVNQGKIRYLNYDGVIVPFDSNL